MFIKVPQCPFTDIGNVTGKFLLAKAGLANFGCKFVDVNARKAIVFTQSFTDDNRILKVKPVERDKPHKDIFTEGQYAIVGASAVCYDLVGLYAVTELDYGLLIKTGSLVQTNKFGKIIFLGMVNNYPCCVHSSNDPAFFGTDNHT